METCLLAAYPALLNIHVPFASKRLIRMQLLISSLNQVSAGHKVQLALFRRLPPEPGAQSSTSDRITENSAVNYPVASFLNSEEHRRRISPRELNDVATLRGIVSVPATNNVSIIARSRGKRIGTH